MRLAIVTVACIVVAIVGAAIWLYTPDRSRAALDAAYHVAPTDYRDIAGLRLHLRDTGRRDGPALLLLHGFGSSLETWDAFADALGPTYRVVRFDLPGFGLTGPDPTGDYSDARSLAVLAGLMDALGIAKASLIGNSLGGKLAWLFAARSPARVDKLILISPDGFASPGFDYGKTPAVPFVVRLLPYTLPTAMVKASLQPAFGDPAALSDALVARYRDFMLAPGVRRAMIQRMEQVRLEPPEPLLRRIKAPVLLLWGDKDGMIPPANAADYRNAIPQAQLTTLPGLGHVPQEEAPDRALLPLRAFLAD